MTPRRPSVDITALDERAAAAAALDLPEESLGDPAAVDAALARVRVELSDDAARLLDALAALGGAAPVSLLEAELLAEDDVTAPAVGVAVRERAAAALADLWELGLAPRDRDSGDHFLLPEIAGSLLRDLRGRLRELGEPAPPAVPIVDEHVLCCAFAAATEPAVRVTREGRPFRRCVDRLAELLAPLLPVDRGPDLVGSLVALLVELGWLVPCGQELRPHPQAARAWARGDAASRSAALLAAEAAGDALLLLRQLRGLGSDRAWPLDVVRRVFRWSLFRLEATVRGAPGSGPSERLAAASRRLELAGLAAATPSSVVLTPAGRAYPDAPAAPGPPGFHVSGELSVLVPRGLSPAVHLAVGALSRLESADVVARYRLDRSVLLRRVEEVGDVEPVMRLLRDHAVPALPETCRKEVERWCARFGEVTSHAGVAVACHVPDRRAEFAQLATASGLEVRPVAEGVVVVAPSDHAALLDWLARAGLTPVRKVEGTEGSDRAAMANAAPASRPSAVSDLPAWDDEPPPRGSGGHATQPPSVLARRLRDKYGREFGRSALAALLQLEHEELVRLEQHGGIRRHLAGRPRAGRSAPVLLDDLLGGELVPVTPRRAREALAHARRERLRCEIACVGQRGRRQRLTVEPLEIRTEAGTEYVRARCTSSSEERLLRLDRIQAVRLVPAARP